MRCWSRLSAGQDHWRREPLLPKPTLRLACRDRWSDWRRSLALDQCSLPWGLDSTGHSSRFALQPRSCLAWDAQRYWATQSRVRRTSLAYREVRLRNQPSASRHALRVAARCQASPVWGRQSRDELFRLPWTVFHLTWCCDRQAVRHRQSDAASSCNSTRRLHRDRERCSLRVWKSVRDECCHPASRSSCLRRSCREPPQDRFWLCSRREENAPLQRRLIPRRTIGCDRESKRSREMKTDRIACRFPALGAQSIRVPSRATGASRGWRR